MGRVVAVVALVALVALYLTWLAGRIDRLYARVAAARAALDAQLVRRAAVAHGLSAHWLAGGLEPLPPAHELHSAAHRALAVTAEPGETSGPREGLENDVSRALHRVLSGPVPDDPEVHRLLAELDGAAVRVGFARQFHNDAVRDTRSLLGRRIPRLLRLGPDEPLPAYFEFDDTVLPVPRRADR